MTGRGYPKQTGGGYEDRSGRHRPPGQQSNNPGERRPHPYQPSRGGGHEDEPGGRQNRGRGQELRESYSQASVGGYDRPPRDLRDQRPRDDGEGREFRDQPPGYGQQNRGRQEFGDQGRYQQERRDQGPRHEGYGNREHREGGQQMQGPRGQQFQNPRSQQFQDSRGQQMQGPRGQQMQGPRGQQMQGPSGQHMQGPRGQQVQGPRPQQFQDRPQQQYQSRPNYQRQYAGGDKAAGDINLEQMMAKLSVRKDLGNQLFLTGKRGNIDELESEFSQGGSKVVSKGTKGKPIKLSTNLYQFALPSEVKFYQYDVIFTPTVESTRFKRKLIKNLEEGLGMASRYVTDGSNIYTTKPLNEAMLSGITVSSKTTEYKVDLRLVQVVQPNSGQVMQIMNVIFGSIMQNIHGWRWSQGNYYDYSKMIPVGGTSVSAYPGFFTSILNYEKGTNLLLDVSHKIITSQNAWDACDRDYRRARTKLIGKIVYTCYNAKTYKVDDIDIQKNIDYSFEYKGKQMTIREYYKEKYGVTLHDTSQPLLAVKPNRREQRAGAPEMIYLVPELCLVTGIDEKDRTNYQFMQKLDTVTKPTAHVRAEKMNEFMKTYDDGDAANVLKAFGIEIKKDMMSVEARILPSVNATQNLNSVTRMPLLETKPLNKWLIVYPSDQNPRDVQKFMDLTTSSMRQMGMNVKAPDMKPYNSMGDMQRALESCQSDTDMVVAVIKGNNKGDYSSAKKTLCVKNPIPSQVITSRLIEKKATPPVCSKVALQINCKLGGAGWSIRDMNTKGTMVVGVDTYHDSETRGASFMGVVASMNDLCTKYHTTWAKQDPGREIAVNFRALITECLRAYENANRRPCRKVVIYRDGVGDGQLAQLRNAEVKEAERAIGDMGWKGTGLLYVVVKKRVHSRFFLKEKGEYSNAPKGSVIDSGATKPNWMDFFLINQDAKAGQGTLTPTHFNVLVNTTDLSIDDIQLLTYQSCFMYFNWNDSIRVPATCQYAHKVAFLIGQAVHLSPSDKLKNKLFYL